MQNSTENSATSVPSFQEFTLPDSLKKSLSRINFATPTPIQAKTLPLALEGKDILGCAQTGTGKTGAFVVPLIARLSQNPEQTSLIMTPTRELALQIYEVVRNLTFFERKMKSALIIGGTSYGMQFRQLKEGPRIIIGTPGRLQDHINQGSLKLNKVGVLVLDEADRMLDMGFAPQIESIMEDVPDDRQTFLFTATLPREIEKMARKFMRDPEHIAVGENSRPVAKINQEVIETNEDRKLVQLFEQVDQRPGLVLIFAGTKRRTDRLTAKFEDGGYDVAAIHGDKSQRQRSDAIMAFKRGHVRILVATDVAARGLDVPHIAHVINFDLPQVPEDYVHRIGRTARAGAEGNALTFVTPSDRGMWKRIQRLVNGDMSSSSGGEGNGGGRPQQRPSFGRGGGGPRRDARGGGRFGARREGGRDGDSRGQEQRREGGGDFRSRRPAPRRDGEQAASGRSPEQRRDGDFRGRRSARGGGAAEGERGDRKPRRFSSGGGGKFSSLPSQN